MQNKTAWISLGILIALLVVGGVFLSIQKKTVSVTGTPSPTSTKDSSDTTPVVDEEEGGIVIEGEEFSFSPNKIKTQPGIIKITFKNTGTMQHDLVFEDLDVGTKIISPGEEETIEVEIVETGTYTFYCSIGSHRQLGMEGELVVE
jgi:plastocyanin